MANPVHVNDNTFDAEVLKTDIPVLTDFWAEWCRPCRPIATIVEEIAAEYAGKVKVAKLNIDVNPRVTSAYGVLSLPTLILFKNGQPVERLVGSLPKKKILDTLLPHLD